MRELLKEKIIDFVGLGFVIRASVLIQRVMMMMIFNEDVS